MTAGELTGKVALVTGGGRGIGRAAALRLAEAGAAVALAARSEDELEAVAGEIASAGGQAVALPRDVSTDGAAADLVDRTRAAFGGLDVLVNAAGISPVYTRTERLDVGDWDAILNVNLRAAFLLCQAAGSAMLEQGSGTIVNVASIGATVALPRLAAYTASKAGLVALTRVLAIEWADRGVRVNAVAPAFVETRMSEGLLSHATLGPATIAKTPIGRAGTPEEVADAVLFLASDRAAYTTGSVLFVDGGWTAQ